MMKFVKELYEARLIRTKDDLKYSYSEVCEYLYFAVLTLDFLSRIKEGKSIAEKYARLTSSYINYTEFRSSATDLYNLIYFVQEDPGNVEKIFGNEDSKKLRLMTQLPRMELNRWLIKLRDPNSRELYFFVKLEQALNVKNSELKDLRRLLSIKNPSSQELTIISYRILNFFRQKMPLFDLKPEVENVLSQGKYTYIK